MDENHDRSLQERVERLETVVAELQSVLKQTHEASREKDLKETGFLPKAPDREQAGPPPSPAKPPPIRSQPSRRSFELPENMRTSEYWLNKIGIGLVLFGVAFLFKYSIDQGWLTPSVRVGFGVLLGVGLVVAGIRISTERRHFSQVLVGGGIATFYITGFAAFQLFTLISHPVAFTFMVSVTLLAFILSLKQNGAVLALIGAIGGLGTPFLLYTGAGNLPGLVGYTCLVLSGTGAIFFYRGWRSLLWISVIGGWSVFLVGLSTVLSTDPKVAIAELWALQLGIVFGWLAFWLLPLIREFVWAKNPTRWHHSSFDSGEKSTSQIARVVLHRHVHLLSVSTPLIALGMSMPIWSLSNQSWGWITLSGAILYGLVSWRLSRLNVIKHFSYTHSLVGVMLLTIAFYLLLDGNTLLFALAAESSVLHFVARRLSDKRVTLTAHLLFGVLGLWVIQRIFYGQAEEIAIFNTQALTDLWVIGLASAVSMLFSSSEERKVYLFLVHIAILGWFLRELSSLTNGQGYVTIAWGIYSVILLVLGLRLNFQRLRTVAIGTLLIVVGKLFIVDLAELETIWRVLLFLGFGGLFLVLSYYFQALWKIKQ
ncbi:MAG: DUF2339 domain-containing protein [Aliifodinibius sp.]|nr:DUF2339 domain-containing protein [Fodinibius sp.]NIY29940.1 DUF2339 domain-containing protein [Fodinibius sp.]